MPTTEPRLTRFLTKRRLDDTSVEDITCSICLDILKKNDVTMLPCGHTFHAKCMMQNILKNNVNCPMCRTPCAHVQEEGSSDGDIDETMILRVADRIREKLKKKDVTVCLARFHLPNGTVGLSHRDKCELLAEQLTHETDDEDESSA